MNWVNDLLGNILREADYHYTIAELFIFNLFFLFIQVALLSITLLAYWQKKKSGLVSKGAELFMRMMVGLTLIPVGSFLNFLYQFLAGNNNQSIVVRNTNILFLIGLLIFVTYYSSYARAVINFSERVKMVYKGLSLSILITVIFCTSIMAIYFFVSLDDNFVTFLFILAAIELVLSTIITALFSIVELFRISSKLKRVRLGMTTLAGIFLLMMGIILSVFFVLEPSLNSVLRIFFIILLYIMPVLSSLFLYWGFFIPFKIQEWAGILPPSFKYLRERQRQLAKNKQKIQGAEFDSGNG